MMVHFYLQGDVMPLLYDYDMDSDGVLAPARRLAARNPDLMIIVLEPGLKTPTNAQRQTIRTIRSINPDWKLVFFYRRQAGRGTLARARH